jgi:CubicO group peptidase (beta-lactamase class C family)
MNIMSDFTNERVGRAVDAALNKGIEDKRIVGVVVFVSLSGRRVYQRAAGLADREAGIPAQLDTVFRWASLTKAVVATVTLALVERGTISLDDPATRFLPFFGSGWQAARRLSSPSGICSPTRPV